MTKKLKAETARLSSFVGAIAIGDLVKSTLGPRGMDKILYAPRGKYGNGEPSVQVTNDGATILRSCGVDNPAAKILVELSKVNIISCKVEFVILLQCCIFFNTIVISGPR